MTDLRATLEQALGSQYAIERELGGGGMSRTYLARETALNRQVVVKVLAPELLAGISIERFRREVLTAAALQHPHVVPVLTAGDAEGLPWFTMPYVDGNSLRQRLEARGVSTTEAVSILRDVARALAYAHGRGIVHRDIKPDNVLLSEGSATVTDFGIAKALNAARTDAGQNATLTQAGTSIGTPTYMAPEQALGDPDTDHRADIYAFGVMAYEMLAGKPPFQGSNPSKILAAHLGEQAQPLGALAPDCPPVLAELVMQCLEKDPDRRPQEAGQLARVLDTVTTSGSGSTVPTILRGGQLPIAKALALWIVATVLVIVTAWAAREVIGLPDWVLPGAAGVMFAGLPVLLATYYVQRTTHRAFTMTPGSTSPNQGTMATLALKASPHLSWKRAWTGGAMAVGGFAILVIGFMVLRAFGIGPMGSLQGKGIFGANEKLVVADFRSPSTDSTLGMTVAEALRTDLAQSTSLDVLTRVALRDELTLMRRPAEARIPYDLAREIAQRAGVKAVLDGEVTQLGSGYVISASLMGTLDGKQLATFREVADNEDALIGAIGKLGKSVRERAGESLKEIQATRELERVTTGSLAALRKYVEAERLASEENAEERAIPLLEEAIQIDSTFAMAWRKLAVLLANLGLQRDRQLAALSKAYQYRQNLTDEERFLTEGSYFNGGPEPDRQKALAAYDAALQLDSTNGTALNNSAIILMDLGRWDEAEVRARKASELDRTFSAAFLNRIRSQVHNGQAPAVLDSTYALMEKKLPESTMLPPMRSIVAWGSGDVVAADSLARLSTNTAPSPSVAQGSAATVASLEELQGRLAESRRWRAKASRIGAQRFGPADAELRAGLDSAEFILFHRGDREQALAVIAATRRRFPFDSVAPSERPWGTLSFLGGMAGDAALVREARQGFERDQTSENPDVASQRLWFEVDLAMAEKRWDDARSRLAELARLPQYLEREGALTRGLVADRLGEPDSAIAAYGQFVDTRNLGIGVDSYWRPQSLLRLGELYEGKGDTANAIDFYGRFVELWKDAEPAQQAKVREIRERIAKLQQQAG